jgi:flagellar hook-associated protein FlgK
MSKDNKEYERGLRKRIISLMNENEKLDKANDALNLEVQVLRDLYENSLQNKIKKFFSKFRKKG